jgi:Tfp pilus assembly protein PilF
VSHSQTAQQRSVRKALAAGDTTRAIRTLTETIASDPAADWAYVDLIALLANLGRIDEADPLAREALTRRPDDARLHDLMGTLLSEQNELKAGEWHFRRALALAGARAEVLANLALNLLRQGRARESEGVFSEADRLRPGDVRTLAEWAKACEVQRELDRASTLLARAADASSPHAVDLLRAQFLARSGDARAALEILESASALNGDAQLERGRLRDRLQRHGGAWQDFVEGKVKLAAEAGGLKYEAAAVAAFFARLRQFFVRDVIARLPRADVRADVPTPVFVVGFPRSGTTLLEQMLSSHPDVIAGGELPFLGDLRRVANQMLPGEPFPFNLAQACIADRHYVAALFRDYYVARADAYGLLQGSHRYFVDKMPFNEVWLPLLRMAFPAAPMIRIVRHPLDVCVSIMANRLNHGFNCGYRLDDLVRHLGAVHELLEHYGDQLEIGGCILRYESLIENPRSEIRRVLDFLALPFDERCLRFHESPRYAPTPSYAQVAEPLNDRSIGRHRHYAAELAGVRAQLAPLLAAWEQLA